jgi:hypothetical protein
MSLYFQFIAAPDVTEADAPQKGADLTQWLIREGVISPETNSECGSAEKEGHPPGPRYVEACEDIDSWGELYGVTDRHGVSIITRRRVYHNCQREFEYTCAGCSARFNFESDEDARQAYTEAIGDWYESGSPGSFACPKCGVERSIVEWQRDGPLVLAYLGIEIWEWPPLSKAFLARIESQIGCPIRYFQGKF